MRKIIANILFIANACIVCAIAFHVDMFSLSGIGIVFMSIAMLAATGLVAKDALFAHEKNISNSIFFVSVWCLMIMMAGFILVLAVNT